MCSSRSEALTGDHKILCITRSESWDSSPSIIKVIYSDKGSASLSSFDDTDGVEFKYDIQTTDKACLLLLPWLSSCLPLFFSICLDSLPPPSLLPCHPILWYECDFTIKATHFFSLCECNSLLWQSHMMLKLQIFLIFTISNLKPYRNAYVQFYSLNRLYLFNWVQSYGNRWGTLKNCDKCINTMNVLKMLWLWLGLHLQNAFVTLCHSILTKNTVDYG